MPQRSNRNGSDLELVLQAIGTKEFNDFRDRAAYVYITGAFPTHLRPFFTALLRQATTCSREPTGLDGRIGTMKIDPATVGRLDLESHPMVRKVREYLRQGYRVQLLRRNDITARRPFTKIYLFREDHGILMEQVTVQIDGSIKDNWD